MASKDNTATYEPRKETLGALMSMTNPSIVVPDWQRNYSWKPDNVETFWNDLTVFSDKNSKNSQSEYFLGSVVIVRTRDGKHNLLDGQQRLATAAILVSVIRDQVKNFNEDAAKQLQKQYLTDYDYITNSTKHKITLNYYDREYFRQLILTYRDSEYLEPSAEIASHNLIKKTRTYFENKIAEFTAGLSGKSKFDKLMSLVHVLLNRMTVIAVYSSNEDSAAEVFETLNDRGIGLSTPDLLRNLIMRRSRTGDQQSIVDLWEEIVSFNSDNEIKNFLRHFWISHYGDVKTQSLYREIKSVIEAEDINSLQISTALCKSAKDYKKVIRADTEYDGFNDVLREIITFGASSRILYPAILAIYQSLDQDRAIDAAKYLLNVFVRHSIILNGENSKLENPIYRACRDLRQSENYDGFISTLCDVAPDDDEVRTAFQRLSINHNGTRRSILRRFELALRGTQELDVANPQKVHVEHIFPQTPQGDELPSHKRNVNRLGNLTLLSDRLNIGAKNRGIDGKRPYFERSELYLTREISHYPNWGLEEINLRQSFMAQVAPDLWPVSVDK